LLNKRNVSWDAEVISIKISAGLRLAYFHLVQNKQPTTNYQIVNELNTLFKVLSYKLPIEQFECLDAEMFGQIAIDVNPANDAAVKAAGLPASFVIVVRPDNYIGYISLRVNIPELRDFMKSAYAF
jgi:hypothetical protein